MAMASTLKDRQARLQESSDSSHCDDERSSSSETVLSNFGDVPSNPSEENIEPAVTGNHGNDAASRGIDDPDSPTPGSPASVKRCRTALENIRDPRDQMKLVGIGQLNAFLTDNRYYGREVCKDKKAIVYFWDLIPAHFLDRLLSAANYQGTRVIDRDWVVKQGVSCIHTFVKLLPVSSRNDKKFAERIDKLLAVIGMEMYVLFETKTMALEILDALLDTPYGSDALPTSEHWPVLLQPALLQLPIIYSIAIKINRNAGRDTEDHLSLRPELHDRISDWVGDPRLAPHPIHLFEHVYTVIRWHMPGEELAPASDWLTPLTSRLLESACVYDTNAAAAARSRQAIVVLSAVLVRCYPDRFSRLLFGAKSPTMEKPAAWMFVQHRIIDIRASIPSLNNSSGDDDDNNKQRISGCYVIVTAFINFLVASSEDDVELPFTPGLLLKIREDISNMCSLTMEYLSDRYEAVHRAPATMANDRLVLSQLWILSRWLREDNSNILINEAVSMMEKVCTGLYSVASDELRFVLVEVLTTIDNHVD